VSRNPLPLLAYLAFVVYGSLVPLDFRPMPLEQAWQAFQQIPFLHLGLESRADWVANGVLYVPLGFMAARVMGGLGRPLAWVLAVTLCFVVATGVEFAQLFFPPRTVSQNDLLAEFIGSALGASLALLLDRWSGRLRDAWSAGGQRLGQRLLELYAVTYLVLCFFPFDLLISRQEVADKFASAHWGIFLALQDRGLVMTLLQLGVEAFLVLPIGLMLARRLRVAPPGAVVYGMLLGVVIEIGQFFIASGISQGASVLSRGVGLGLGAWLAPRLAVAGVVGARRWLRRHALVLLAVYLPLLLFASGWFRGPWQGMDAASQTWANLRLLPFYYHYYTSEAVALFSLGSVALMYLPLAALGWAFQARVAVVTSLVASVALVVEAGKLFVAGQHPDPTNLIIAAAACWVALRLAALAESPRLAERREEGPVLPPAGTLPEEHAMPGSVRRGRSLIGLALAFAAVSALLFPSWAWLVLGVLTGAAIIVWTRPLFALVIVPAMLPVFDLAPWTGRMYWDEFDLLLLVVLAVGWHRTPPSRAGGVRGPVVVLALLGLSYAISMARGLLPLQWPDLNSFIGYYSGFNALRIAKGAIWAAAFIALYRRLPQTDAEKHAAFGWGMCIGLFSTVVVVIWERLAFADPLDFGADYRVTGPFSAMHTGGAYIECYLSLAAAYLLWVVLLTRRPLWRWLGAMLLLLTTYALMVTYSRNGFAALLVVLLVMVGAAFIRRSGPTRQWPAALLVGALMTAVALPVLLGPFAMHRLATTGRDQSIRWAHWTDALAMRDGAWATTLFGVGLGRFPATHYWRSAEPVHAASFGLANEETETFLRLGTGAAVYVEQFVEVKPGQRYRLSLDVRAAGPAKLGIALCEKWMLTSGACDGAAVDAGASQAGWHRSAVTLTTEQWQPRAWYRMRPAKLAIYNGGGSSTIDVDNIRLESETGSSLLANGDFEAGLDRWFFSTDVDPPWHIHSMPVTILFEQGWMGLLAWTLALALAIGVAARRVWRGDAMAAPVLAALLAVLVSGLVNTLIDAPRFLWLLIVLMWFASTGNSRTAAGRYSNTFTPAATSTNASTI
jgi:VanZ family protein